MDPLGLSFTLKAFTLDSNDTTKIDKLSVIPEVKEALDLVK